MENNNSQVLIAENISSGYNKRQILYDVSVSLNKGEIIAVIGRNGAGKSTLFNNIMEIVPKWSGKILLDGMDVTNKPSSFINANGISYMPQGPLIFPQLSIFENLIFNVGDKSVTRINIDSRIEQLLSKTAPNMWQIMKKRILPRLDLVAGSLSGGERQILCIIRTLINNKIVLLLDEPTIGIAAPLMVELKDLLNENVKKNCGVLFIEQKVIWSLKLCHRVYIMQRGEIVYEGDPKPLLENEKLLSNCMGLTYV